MEYVPRLKNKYNTEIVENLKKNYKSVMQVPKLVKISLNQGVGNADSDIRIETIRVTPDSDGVNILADSDFGFTTIYYGADSDAP